MNARKLLDDFVLGNRYLLKKFVLTISYYFNKAIFNKIPDSDLLRSKLDKVNAELKQLVAPTNYYNWLTLYPILVSVIGLILVFFFFNFGQKSKNEETFKLLVKNKNHEGENEKIKPARDTDLAKVVVEVNNKKAAIVEASINNGFLSMEQKSERRREIGIAFTSAEKDLKNNWEKYDSKSIDVINYLQQKETIKKKAQGYFNGPSYFDFEISSSSVGKILGGKVESICLEQGLYDKAEIHIYGYVKVDLKEQVRCVDLDIYDKFGSIMEGCPINRYDKSGNEVFFWQSDTNKDRLIMTFGKMRKMRDDELAFHISFETLADALRASKIVIR
jgi:hypothetical protein